MNANMNINAIVHPAEEGGYWAEVPELPGCFTEGDSLDEIRVNLREAISLYLEDDPLHREHSAMMQVAV